MGSDRVIGDGDMEYVRVWVCTSYVSLLNHVIKRKKTLEMPFYFLIEKQCVLYNY